MVVPTPSTPNEISPAVPWAEGLTKSRARGLRPDGGRLIALAGVELGYLSEGGRTVAYRSCSPTPWRSLAWEAVADAFVSWAALGLTPLGV